jgi:alpha-L-fucosidase
MSGEEVIQMLIDIVSKNGNLLLNVVQTPEGDLEQDVLDILETIAAWMEVNSVGIYGSRPWKVYGEGPSMNVQQEKGPHGHIANVIKDVRKYLPGDFRFTVKGKKLYAFCMEMPEGDIQIRSLGLKTETGQKVKSVKLLGSAKKVQWTQNDAEVRIERPADLPKFDTVVFEIQL